MAFQAEVRRIDAATSTSAESEGRVLRSLWDGLNANLLASIYPVNAQGAREPGTNTVESPPTEFSTEIAANWQSPFEQTGPESRLPSLMAMAQSGQLESYGTMLLSRSSDGSTSESLLTQYKVRLSSEVTRFSREAQGRTGMTKLNSTQVFNGAPPVKFTMSLPFRAFADPTLEVEEPIDQLVAWALPRELAANSSIPSALQALKNGQGFLKALMPSQAPQLLALKYGGRLHSPVVIENIALPGCVPRSSDGRMLNAHVQITMATLTALDANDWGLARAGRPTRLLNNS